MPASTVRDLAVTRLGGLTNLVFRIDHGPQHYVLRIPGKGTEEYINRSHEAHAARETARVQVSPEVLHFDTNTGVMVSRLVEGAVTMTPAQFRSRPGAPARAGAVLRQLHRSDAVFNFRFELFAMIDDYLRVLAGKDSPAAGRLPRGRDRGRGGARGARGPRACRRAACHCDPLCENFLDAGERMWLVDWEYSGMNDPLWDLGRPVGRGRVQRGAGRGDDPGLLRRRGAAGGARTDRDLQGHV